MKKLLLLSLIFIANSIQSQVVWQEYSTAQPNASTGMSNISWIDANNVWISNRCGTTGCTSIRRYSKSTDAGLTWSTAPINLGPTSANLEISYMHAVSNSIVYVSAFGTSGAVGGIWKTIDGGATWNKQPSAVYNAATSFPNLVHFWGDIGVTMGDPLAGGGFEMYRTINGGTTWTPISGLPATLGDNEYGYTASFTTFGNSIWINTAYGRLLRSSDQGATWTIVQTPIVDFGGQVNGTETADVDFQDENNGILISSTYNSWKTTDAGTTWTPVLYNGTIRGNGIARVSGLPNTYFCFGTDAVNDDVTLFRGSSFTTDNGLNWVNVNDTYDSSYVRANFASFYSPTAGLAGGFSTNPTTGGIFKFLGLPSLANSSFSTAAFTVSPNPTSDKLNLSGANINQVQITDILGKVVFNNSYSSLSNVELSIAEFTAGMYMVKVTNNEGISSVVKVVKQ